MTEQINNQEQPQQPPVGVVSNSTKNSLNGPFPQELAGWNWGAFLLSWIWSIGNQVWIGLLALAGFIPGVGPIIVLATTIYLGIKGNELAWKARKWESVEQFKAVQKKWTKWAFIFLAIVGLLIVVSVVIVLVLMALTLKNMDYTTN